MFVQVLIAAALMTSLASASDVVTITPETIDGVLENKDTHVFLEVYAPWCGHCKVSRLPLTHSLRLEGNLRLFFPLCSLLLSLTPLRTSPQSTSWWARPSARAPAWWWPR